MAGIYIEATLAVNTLAVAGAWIHSRLRGNGAAGHTGECDGHDSAGEDDEMFLRMKVMEHCIGVAAQASSR